MTTQPAEPGRAGALYSLTPAQCRERLSDAEIGRIAWAAPDGPHVLPVNFVLDAGDIVFRTSPYGLLSQLTRRQLVAFEVDEIHREQREGWSVEVRGHAEGMKQSQRLLDLFRVDAVVPWAVGSRQLYICISPVSITGRGVRAPV